MLNDNRHRWLWPITLMVCAALALWFGAKREWHNLAMYGMIHADAQGYYGYLVAAFIERSFDWKQVIAAYNTTYFGGGASDFTVVTDHGYVNKYYVGTAVLMLPFFLLSCLAAAVMGQPVDGYAVPFHIGMMLSALFYAIMGLRLMGRYLHGKGFSWPVISATALGVFAGTGLLFYSVMEPAMSHVYSFFLFSAFIFLADRAMAAPVRGRLIALAAVLALIALVRPTNAVIVLSLPFIAGGWRPFMVFLKAVFSDRRLLVPSMVVAVSIVALQLLMYQLQVGRPLVWSYSGEGFNFLAPEVMNVLFSYKKGLFVYYPWTLLAALGLIVLAVQSRAAALWLVVFLGLAVYIISSWWSWYYGASFGMRAMVEYLPFFMVLMAYLLQAVPVEFRSGVMVLSFMAIPVNLIQTYQYNKFILHWDQMDEDRFWQVFLKTDRRYEGIFYRTAQAEELPTEDRIMHRFSVHNDMEAERPDWGNQGRTDRLAFSGRYSSMISGANPYGNTIGIPWGAMGPEGRKVLVATFIVRSKVERPALALAYSFNAGERNYGHGYLYCTEQVSDKGLWTAVRLIAELPRAEAPEHVWVVYPYTTGNDTIHVDDLRYEVITLREDG
jgi:hypothetical protein